MTIIQNRLKRLQVNLIEEYYEHKGNVDWGRWKKELEQRKEEVRTELKRGLKPRAESGNFTDIDALIDKSWDELLAVIGGRVERRANAGIDEEKLQALLNRVLLNSPLAVPPAAEALEIPIPFAASIEDPAELKNAEAIDERAGVNIDYLHPFIPGNGKRPHAQSPFQAQALETAQAKRGKRPPGADN